LSYGGVMLAGLLKFYPLVVMGVSIRERPRAFITIAILSTVTVVGFYLCFRTELHEAFRNVPTGGYFTDVFAASNLPCGILAMIAQGRFSVDLPPMAPAMSLYAAATGWRNSIAACSSSGPPWSQGAFSPGKASDIAA
jgi:hypothetical protein